MTALIDRIVETTESATVERIKAIDGVEMISITLRSQHGNLTLPWFAVHDGTISNTPVQQEALRIR